MEFYIFQKVGKDFKTHIIVKDNPKNPTDRKETYAEVKITVVGSDKQPPSIDASPKEITKAENFNIFSENLFHISAK